MLRGRGMSLLEDKKSMCHFQRFKISEFQKSQISKFQSFKVAKFQNSEFKILKVVVPTFPTFSQMENIRLPKVIIFKKDLDFFLDYLECPGVSKYSKYWFGESWSRPPGRRTIKIGGLRVFQ